LFCFQASVFVEPVNGHQINPYDLAIDPYARMVYWTDAERRVITVTRIDGEDVGVIVDDVDARSIALTAEHGYAEDSFTFSALSCTYSYK